DRKYDAENRMTQAAGTNGAANYYVYDGDGKRVRRVLNNGVGGFTETWQVYGIDGELLAEYAANTVATIPQKEYGYRGGQLLIVAEQGSSVKWLVSDHLGTPRIIVDTAGSLTNVRRHDYLPFGEELTPVMAGGTLRSGGNGYAADAVRQKFAGYEQDNETGLDFAQARYYASVQGRFVSPDPLLASGIEEEPQSWNRYAYCINRPLKFTDPSGLIWGFLETNGGDSYVWYNDEAALKAAGATVVNANAPGNAFVYQAVGEAYIRLDLGMNYWRGYETKGEADLGRTLSEDGSSALGDLGNTLNLFMGVQGAGNLTFNLARGAFLRASTVEVFRVESMAGAHTRILIGEAGEVTAEGNKMLFLNFGVKSRAQDFLAKRLSQGFEDSVIKSFRVQKSFLKELQSSSVLESEAAAFPGRPLLVDVTKAANQFGLRSAQIQSLQKSIVQGSGKIKF
ncbi:MAG: RHS repeat-associated core domain-containing protein, partial [Acidobacteriota bacterium]